MFEFEDSNNAGIGNRQEYDRNARAKQRIKKHRISANLGVWFTRIGRSQDAKKHGEIKSNHKKCTTSLVKPCRSQRDWVGR